MNIILDDHQQHLEFAPLTLTRPVGDLRVGILTNKERWSLLVPTAIVSFRTEEYLSTCFKEESGILVNASVIPTRGLINALNQYDSGVVLMQKGIWIATIGEGGDEVEYNQEELIVLKKRWDLYQKNAQILEHDFELITSGRSSEKISNTNQIIGDPSKIFLEEGAKVEAAILNTNSGPIYLGKEAEIMEGSIIRGGLALCHHATIKMGAKIYGATTVGPHCKVGGEVSNTIFQAYSNKGHDGFLGNSLIGEWCNLGADTNTSNLKNNYGLVKTYSYRTESVDQTDVQFMGLTMGDHSKSGINTMFNTATVVGVSSNLFGAEFPPKFIPSFQWGMDGTSYQFDKAIESAQNMMSRRGIVMSDEERALLKWIADSQ